VVLRVHYERRQYRLLKFLYILLFLTCFVTCRPQFLIVSGYPVLLRFCFVVSGVWCFVLSTPTIVVGHSNWCLLLTSYMAETRN
jgi:hypothetical protein